MAGFDEAGSGEGLGLRCVSCGSTYEYDPWLFSCPRCGGPLEVVVPRPRVGWGSWSSRPRGVWRYREALPPVGRGGPVSLGEGGTPLVPVEPGRLGLPRGVRVWVKFEGANPTGSFKDRGMAVGVSVARGVGARVVYAASTGNTAASLAAYAARAGLAAVVALPRGGVALGKLLQAILHGALVVEVEGSFDDAMRAALEAAARGGGAWYPLNSFNPIRLEGQKTLAYEVVEELGEPPDLVVVPVGNGGNIAAVWKGFRELWEWGLASALPGMVGVQAEGSAPIAAAWATGAEPVVERPSTVASAIRIGRPVNWLKALRAVEESGGAFVTVSDGEILEAQRLLARGAGVAAEPAGAAALAGLRVLAREGLVGPGDRVVLVATGHALKDPDSMASAPAARLRASGPRGLLEALEAAARGVAAG